MRVHRIDPPREFAVGSGGSIQLRHVANVELEPDEQVTFVTATGTEYDVVRKEWGYYATPSLNARLQEKGLRGALVRGAAGQRLYLLLVESERRAAFLEYVREGGMEIVGWLDTDDAIERLLAGHAPASAAKSPYEPADCEFCGARDYRLIRVFDAPPPGETRFAALAEAYQRSLWECGGCGHVVNQTLVDPETLYPADYVDATYGAGFTSAFERVLGLPPEDSDNWHRVERVVSFVERQGGVSSGSVLDIGSGLCVFGAAMQRRGWRVTALDPDERAARHAREVVGVSAIHGNFMSYASSQRFDLVTLNKVLEHVSDPVRFLAHARTFVASGGFAYVEVPDAEEALREGPEREEFFIEHRGAYSAASAALLIRRSGFVLMSLERLREPSGKYTLAAFLRAH